MSVVETLEAARDAYDDARGAWLRALAAAADVLPMDDLVGLCGMTPGHIREELRERDRLKALAERVYGIAT